MKTLRSLPFLCGVLLFAQASRAAAQGLDLLASPLESAQPYAWKHFSEDPQTKLSDVWQLGEGDRHLRIGKHVEGLQFKKSQR